VKDVSIQTDVELGDNLSQYENAHTNGREPDKDYIFDGYIKRICAELAKRRGK
jgi:hypothetical protein